MTLGLSENTHYPKQETDAASEEETNSKIMAFRGEIGWQSEKTLAECMRYMLDNEVATDVCFEVGPPDGTTVNIRAHKYMLISRSPVFEAMFSSGMTECRNEPEEKIRIEDIEADIFKLLLTYMYYEDLPVDFEAVSLICAADKYMLPKIVRECGKRVLKDLNVNNVIRILEQSLLFSGKDLTTECLKLIGLNSNSVLAGTEIMRASRQAIEAILQMDNLLSSESELYATSIGWAKQQLLRDRSIENPTDQEIRETLGDLLFNIRFPTMEPIEFAKLTRGKNVLTLEEKESIYYFLVTKEQDCLLQFPTEIRNGEEVWVDRSVSLVTAEWRYTNKTVDVIDFKADQDILLSGVGLYTGHKGSGYDADVEVLQSGNSVFKKRVTVPFTGDSTPFKIPMDKQIVVRAGTVLTITSLAHSSIGYYSKPCKPVCTSGNVTVTFSKNPGIVSPKSTTTEIYGQIPRLYFFKLNK